MTPVPAPRSPGSMTVSFLFGWQHILVGLVLLVALAVLFFLVLAAGRGNREEWQAALEARSSRYPSDPPEPPRDHGAVTTPGRGGVVPTP